MSFRRVVVQNMFVLLAFATGAALAQAPAGGEPTPPGSPETTANAAPATDGAAEHTTSASSTPASGHTAQAVTFGDAKAGAGKAAVCGACHGMDGNSTDKQYPKLAGQNEAYIVRQLQAFKDQRRVNPIMVGFVAPLSEQDMHDIGAYFATQSARPGVADEALVERGQALFRGGDAELDVPACLACHGPSGQGMAGAGYPHLAGQWTDYVAATLNAWKGGTSWGNDIDARIMPTIVSRLSEADINALASYIEGLHTANAGTTTASK